jgi:uncharacterized protein (TIGR04255 family)
MEIKNKYEVYSKAPIIMAILQFRYNKIEEFDSKLIRKVGEEIKREYPTVNDSVRQTVRFDPASETKVSLDHKEINGVQFVSTDKMKTLTVGTENFTLQIDGEYPGWKIIKEEIKKLWNLFNGHLTNLQLSGISMRYVNKINLPLSPGDISKYFTSYIYSSTGDHPIIQFQFRYTSVENNNLIMHVGHAVESAIEDKTPYLFDIDVIRVGEITNEESVIWNIFEELRDKKNFIFNDTLTEQTKNLIR